MTLSSLWAGTIKLKTWSVASSSTQSCRRSKIRTYSNATRYARAKIEKKNETGVISIDAIALSPGRPHRDTWPAGGRRGDPWPLDRAVVASGPPDTQRRKAPVQLSPSSLGSEDARRSIQDIFP